MDSSLAASRAAAQRHARAVAAGPPRSARWTTPSAVVTAVGAAVAWPLLRPASLVLAAVTVLLVAIVREDRRSAWRYVPEPVAPAAVLPPRRRPLQPQTAVRAPAPSPAVTSVHIPTQPVPLPALPEPRLPVAHPRSGGQPAPVASPVRRPRTATT